MKSLQNHFPFKGLVHLATVILLINSVTFIVACKGKKKPDEKVIVKQPQQMNDQVRDLINANLDYSKSTNGKIDDSTIIYQFSGLDILYGIGGYVPIWSSSQQWKPQGDSLLKFIGNLKHYGLFPEDYHSKYLLEIKDVFEKDIWKEKDTRDAAIWAKADLTLSDALISVFHDIKFGRLPKDSITLRTDSVLNFDLVSAKFSAIASGLSIDSVIASLEPIHHGYHDLKMALGNFLNNADFKPIRAIPFPNKNRIELNENVKRRLFETGYLDSTGLEADSVRLASILKKYQKEKKLTVDGKIGAQTVRMLNLSDAEKFDRIAITMDRYKMLPDSLPEKYIWVNIPSYRLRLISNDSLILSSKVVVGKPITRTPVLTSAVSELITYPQWNIPASIVEKEIIPGMKRDSGYLRKKGYMLLDSKNEEVSPDSVNWAKYTRAIPYKVIQGSGDDNALGVLKFNFPNKYSVYLHDTNQRSFFGQDTRALSHGCVRVQEWEKMAYYIMENENNGISNNKSRPPLPVDSLTRWLVIKEKHSIPIKTRVPLFIRYFTCEAEDGQINFYEDIYNEDKYLTEKLFAGKRKME